MKSIKKHSIAQPHTTREHRITILLNDEEENILVVINPAARTVEFPYDGQIGEVLYQFGRGLSSDGKKITIQGQSVVFVKIS